MNILQIHNYYRQSGGEDTVVNQEKDLLELHGHAVTLYSLDNNDFGDDVFSKIKVAFLSIWNPISYMEIGRIIDEKKPNIVHVHNTWPLISPSVFWICRIKKVPVIQTIHNYRLMCLNGCLYRQDETTRKGKICNICVDKKFKWAGVRLSCYRGSKIQSLVLACSLYIHHKVGTWTKTIDQYIALTQFMATKLIQSGVPADKISVKANYVAHMRKTENSLQTESEMLHQSNNPYFLYVGRISDEKGVEYLLDSWNACRSDWLLQDAAYDLVIIGGGDIQEKLENHVSMYSEALDRGGSIFFLGKQDRKKVLRYMQNALFVVLPSKWFEGFPMTLLEAFNCNAPIIAPDHGAFSEIVEHEKNGYLYDPRETTALSRMLKQAASDKKQYSCMKNYIFNEVLPRYSLSVSYQQLINVYTNVINKASGI